MQQKIEMLLASRLKEGWRKALALQGIAIAGPML
jgi:hypothetical protein